MKILHVIPSISTQDGGPSVVALETCRHLAQAGAEVVLATTDWDGAGRLPVSLGQEVDFEDFRAIFFSCWGGAFIKHAVGLRSWMDRELSRFDLVHIHAVFNAACVTAASAARGAGVPYVIRPLGTLDPWSLSVKPWRKRLAMALAVRRMIAGAAALHFTTAEERDLAEGTIGRSRSFVLPNGVDDALWNLVRSVNFSRRDARLLGHPYLVFISRLHPKKNVETLLHAFAEVTGTPEFEHWRLVVAGSGPSAYERSLQELSASLNLDQRVVFTGWLDKDERCEALAGAEGFVLISAQENFGIAVAEAMAASLPVVVSVGVNLASEISRVSAGWVCEPTRASLVLVLREVLAGANERQKRGRAGRELAETSYKWDRIAGQLIGIYRSLTPGPVLTPGPSPQVVERGGREDGVRTG